MSIYQQRRAAMTKRRRNRATESSPPNRLTQWLGLVGIESLFSITAAEGTIWIDPFSGTPVRIGTTLADTAARHWAANLPPNPAPLPAADLAMHRWYQEIIHRLPKDRRFRIFATAGWVDPYSGTLVHQVERADGLINQQTVWAMARHLASNEPADPSSLRDYTELAELHEQYNSHYQVEERTPSTNLLPSALPAVEVDKPAQAEPVAAPLETTEQTSAVQDDLNRAANVQTQMMGDIPDIAGYDVAVHFAPQSSVGGDFYLFLKSPNGHHRIIVGDVTGHGVQAALVATSVTKSLKLLSANNQSLSAADLLVALNSEIKPDLASGQFVTCCVIEFDPTSHRMDVLLAGHHPVLIANASQRAMLQQVGKSGAVVGMLPDSVLANALRSDSIELQPDDTVIIYTDGVSESIDEEGNEFGNFQLAAIMLDQAEASVSEGLEAISRATHKHRGGVSQDDITMLALRRLVDTQAVTEEVHVTAATEPALPSLPQAPALGTEPTAAMA